MTINKHCQRHNGPKGWVLITSSNTNQISSSESRPSIIFKISTKHQPLHKTWASKSWPNLASESWPRLNFITTWSISSKTMTKPRFILDSTFYKTSAEKNWPNSSFKSCLNFNFKILTKLFAQSLNKHLDFWPNLGFQICNKLLPTRSSSATVATSTSFELASSHARVTSIKFTKQQWNSQWVSDKGKQWSDKLVPTRSSSATVTTSTSFELASSHARVTSIKFTKQESVSELVSDNGKQWLDS